MNLSTKTVYLAASISIGLTMAFPSSAYAAVVSVEMAQSKKGCNAKSHIPVIEVEGKAAGKYSKVNTRELWTCLKVRGQKPTGGREGIEGTLTTENNRIEIPAAADTRIHGMAFRYIGPLSEGGTYRQNPVALCNNKARGLKGQKLKNFIKQGDFINIPRAYKVSATATWKVRKNTKNALNPNYHKHKHEKWDSANTIPALIRCLPTQKYAKKSPSKTNHGKRTNPQPQPKRSNPASPIKSMSLAAAHSNVKRIGNWICPSNIRLKARVDVNRSFKGNGIFVGSKWLSNNTRLKFNKAGGRYVIANYPIKWSVGGLSAGGKKAPRKKLNFSFNVSTPQGKLIKSSNKHLQVTCRAPKPGAMGKARGHITN